MTYQCGIGRGMEALGLSPCRPHIRCDGCGLVLDALTKNGLPHRWLLDQTAPRGWSVRIPEDGQRIDHCPRCKGEDGT